ncbi:MAG: histidine kinase [Bryobacteraceae bacterium]|nr:histidine kinase [Bryobacteraceae bacterium]
MPGADTLTVHEPLLVNTIGHSAGTLLFGIFLVLLLGDRTGRGQRRTRLSFTAAALAFAWNLASLLVMALASGQSGVFSRLVTTAGSSALSLLPAVLLHLSLDTRRKAVVIAGYALSTIAVLIHSTELFLPAPHYHRLALIVITLGFGALTAGAAVLEARARGRLSVVVGTMSLFLFAMSFVHFDTGEALQAWPLELVLHHAGIPLALFVLLADYRFVLVDAFLRFLANFLLAAIVTFSAVAAARWLEPGLAASPFRQGILLVGATLCLILFATLRTALQRALTRLLFRRPELETVLAKLRGIQAGTEAEYLEEAGKHVASFMDAHLVHPQAAPPEGLVFPALATDRLAAEGVDVVVPLRLAHGETRHFFLGRRLGGRRYLSEDLEALGRLAAEIAGQLEVSRESELRRLVSQAELRALQSQIHPHFLFNALNTLYGVIPKEAAGARRTVLNLADIFRYFLQSDRSTIALEREMDIVRAYLEIESLRLGEKLKTEIDIHPSVLQSQIPVLSIEPLVENAVKHGVGATVQGGVVRVIAAPDGDGVRIEVQDTGRGFEKGARRGVGLENVARRLQLCYGSNAGLEVESNEGGTRVGYRVPVRP